MRVPNNLVFDKVTARIAQPGSKLASIETLAEIGVESASYASIKRKLPTYATTEFRDELTRACAAHAGIGPGVLVLYDVTTLYFETDEGDEFRKPGFSKERRLKPQITVGLLSDASGFPLSVGAFEGNMAETKTMLPMIRRFQESYDLIDVTIVADTGMFSQASKDDIVDAGLSYIIGTRFKGMPCSFGRKPAAEMAGFCCSTGLQRVDHTQPLHDAHSGATFSPPRRYEIHVRNNLAADKLTKTRQRIQQATCGHRGRSGDPLYGTRRIMLTRMELLTETQRAKLESVLAPEEHAAVDVTHHVYQDIIAAYGHSNKKIGKRWMYKVLCRIRTGVQELGQLGRSMWKRRREILAGFDHGASNGPVEAINGRLEHLRGIALGFRNLSHYILRSLIHSGGLQAKINAL